jgi:uncharacterized membrane protein YhdT
MAFRASLSSKSDRQWRTSSSTKGVSCTGLRAWVLPVRVVDPEMPDAIETTNPVWAAMCSDVVDLVAFSPAAPYRFALRCGIATVLGWVEPQYLAPDTVPIHRDITDWFRAGCRGLVLLTRCSFEAARVLRQCLEIEAEDAAHAVQLRRILAESLPKWPQIRTRLPRGSVA